MSIAKSYDMSKYQEVPKMQGWKAYYGDGTVFTSKEYKWVDIPVINFQYLKIFFYRHTDTYAGNDLYCITSDSEEILKLIKEDYRNIKIGKKITNWKEFDLKIVADKERITEMI